MITRIGNNIGDGLGHGGKERQMSLCPREARWGQRTKDGEPKEPE